MVVLFLGLIIFMLPHSVRMLAPEWRQNKLETLGASKYAVGYSLVSLLGLVLIVWGFGQSRLDPVYLWQPPAALYHLSSLLMLIAFIVLIAAYIPGNHIKQRIGHPMLLAIKIWAIAHLLANGRLGDVVLFGVFLIWSVCLFIYLRKQDRLSPPVQTGIKTANTIMVVAVGIVLWIVFALWLHIRLIGVAPFASV